jgi:sugar phosphate isomerase/epimerase
MDIQFFCPRWGSENLSWDDFLKKAKTERYAGVEYAIAKEVSREELDQVWEKAEQYGLLIIAQHYDTADADFNRHYDTYSEWFEKLRPFNMARINSQTGKDFFSFEQNKSLTDVAEDFSINTAIPVSHETHRNKFSFAAHITKEYLIRIQALRLTLDISHWVCVAESYLEDQLEAVDLAISRTDHIHARIGYAEGPQISDPRIAEWQDVVNVHLSWWDKVIERKRKEGQSVFTICPEFGPYPYMVVSPLTRRPVADQWEVNVHMMNLLKERYARPKE